MIELALRAEDYAFDESKKLESSVELVFKNRVFFKSFKEKFGELIIKEMLVTCEEHPAWTARMIAEQIKEHFGVEE